MGPRGGGLSAETLNNRHGTDLTTDQRHFMHLTAAHWIYAVFVLAVIVTMAVRRDALIPCIAGAFILGWIITGSPLGAIETVFKSSVVATRELLDIILVISMIVGLAAGLEAMRAEQLMVAPARKLMRSPEVAFWVIGVVMLIASYFLWPSPATALVGAVLVPAASSVRLPAISAAVAMNIFGHGIALSTDYVIQGAPSISARAANLPVEAVMLSGIPLILTMSIVTVTASFIIVRRDIARAQAEAHAAQESTSGSVAISAAAITAGDLLTVRAVEGAGATVAQPPRPTMLAQVAAVVVPLSYLLVIVALIGFRIRGGEATAIIGGVTLLLLSVFTLINNGADGFDLITEHLIK